jgi:hypothetical protein
MIKKKLINVTKIPAEAIKCRNVVPRSTIFIIPHIRKFLSKISIFRYSTIQFIRTAVHHQHQIQHQIQHQTQHQTQHQIQYQIQHQIQQVDVPI